MRLSVITTCMVAAMCCLACRKNSTPAPVKTPPAPGPDPVTVISYPYTDTFSGALRLRYYAHGVDKVTVDSPFLFYVIHPSAATVIFVSADTIRQIEFPSRYFDLTYAVDASNIYRFGNYYATNGTPMPPLRNPDSIIYSRLSLHVTWDDIYDDEIRISQPTGGVHRSGSRGDYSGTWIRHSSW